MTEWRACCDKHKWKGRWTRWDAKLRADFRTHFREYHPKRYKRKGEKMVKQAMKNIHKHREACQ